MSEDDLLLTVAVDVDKAVETAVVGLVATDVFPGGTDDPGRGLAKRPVIGVHYQVPVRFWSNAADFYRLEVIARQLPQHPPRAVQQSQVIRTAAGDGQTRFLRSTRALNHDAAAVQMSLSKVHLV